MFRKHSGVEPQLDDTLKQALDSLRETPERDPESTAHNRMIYIQQVRSLLVSPGRPSPQPWSLFFHKLSTRGLLKPAVALLLVLFILIGSTGMLAYAAQNDLPGEPLYTLKLAGEDLRLALTLNEMTQMEQIQNMIQNRVTEMLALAKNGEEVPEPLANRLVSHLENALRIAAGMNDEDMQQAMLMIRTRTEAQIRELNRINLTGNGIMLQIHQRLQEQLRLADLGLEDPQQFRQNTRLQTQNQPEEPQRTGTPKGTATQKGSEANGHQGPQGSQEPQGPQGTPEPQGPQGPQNTGTPQNTSAPQGPQDPQGPQGPNGTPEPQGPQNTDAPEDPPGPQGPPTSESGDPGHHGYGKPTFTPTPEPEDFQNVPSNPGNGKRSDNGKSK
jgi:hypothetical protein